MTKPLEDNKKLIAKIQGLTENDNTKANKKILDAISALAKNQSIIDNITGVPNKLSKPDLGKPLDIKGKSLDLTVIEEAGSFKKGGDWFVHDPDFNIIYDKEIDRGISDQQGLINVINDLLFLVKKIPSSFHKGMSMKKKHKARNLLGHIASIIADLDAVVREHESDVDTDTGDNYEW